MCVVIKLNLGSHKSVVPQMCVIFTDVYRSFLSLATSHIAQEKINYQEESKQCHWIWDCLSMNIVSRLEGRVSISHTDRT